MHSLDIDGALSVVHGGHVQLKSPKSLGVRKINNVESKKDEAVEPAKLSVFAPNSRIPPSLARSIYSTKATYRQVGRSGLRVSNPILGTLGFGDSTWMPWCLNEARALPLIHEAYSRGINTWDTANAYSNGQSEEILGRAIREYRIPRRKVVLMTKVGRILADPDESDPGDFVAFSDDAVGRSKDYANQYGLSRTAIFEAVDQSLARLQTSYIDVLHVHRFDESVPAEETMEALHQLVVRGKVRYLAASSMWTYQFAMLQGIAEQRGWTKFVAMQNHYSLLYREEEREMVKYCNKTGIGLFPWSPLAEGHLARPRHSEGGSVRSNAPSRFGNGDSEADQTIIDRVQQVAKARSWTMSQVALAWLNRRVTAPIVGLHSVSRMEEAVACRGELLSEEEEAYLEQPYQPKQIQGHF